MANLKHSFFALALVAAVMRVSGSTLHRQGSTSRGTIDEHRNVALLEAAEQRTPEEPQISPVSCGDLTSAGIIPDVLRPRDCKSLHLAVSVHLGGSPAMFGEEVSAEVAAKASAPMVKVEPAPAEGTEYVLFITDPDAPSRESPSLAEWAHWVAVSRTGYFDEESASPLPWAPPSPPSGSGFHRYVLLVYVRPKTDTPLSGVPAASERAKWGGKQHAHLVARENGLTLGGANWFVVEG